MSDDAAGVRAAEPFRARTERAVERLVRGLSGPALPVFLLGLLLCFEAALVALMLIPRADTGLGAFAEEFRAWCFGSDPVTGRANWGYAAGMLAPPLFVAAAVAWLWSAPLAALRERPAAAVRPALAAMLATAAAVTGLVVLAPRVPAGELPFPAAALRTELAAPPLRLVDQAGEAVDLAALRGRVVMLTSVYASCGRTCPMIMAEAKRLVGDLTPEERAGLCVVAVTLDPEHDTPDVLAQLAEAQGMERPLWHLVTGEPARVEETLDRMNVSRTRDSRTGQIDHANLFLLVDREGRLAYRFTLGPQQERWLAAALRTLLREPGDAG